jgi:small subunit ribosomal protein S6
MSIRRVYETTIIINAALEDTDIDAVLNKIISYLENYGAAIEETNKWGRRRLAYPINKKYNGFYVHLIYNIQPNSIPAFERFLVLEDTILRHLTLQLEPELRAYRKEKSLAEGKSGETTMSSFVEVEKPVGRVIKSRNYSFDKNLTADVVDAEIEDDIIDEIGINEDIPFIKDDE